MPVSKNELNQSFNKANGAKAAVVMKIMADYNQVVGWINGQGNPHGIDLSADQRQHEKASLDAMIMGDGLKGGKNIGLLGAVQNLSPFEFRIFLMNARAELQNNSEQGRSFKSRILENAAINYSAYAEEEPVFQALYKESLKDKDAAAEATPAGP